MRDYETDDDTSVTTVTDYWYERSDDDEVVLMGAYSLLLSITATLVLIMFI